MSKIFQNRDHVSPRPEKESLEQSLRQLERDIEKHDWEGVARLFDSVASRIFRAAPEISTDNALRLIALGNTPRLYRRTLRFSRSLLEYELEQRERSLILNAIGTLAENSGRSRLAEKSYSEAERFAPDGVKTTVRLDHAYFMLRRGRTDEAVALLNEVDLQSLSASVAVNQIYGFIAMMRGEDVERYAERLQGVAHSVLSESPDSDLYRYDVASRALHMNFYLELQTRNWKAARERLRMMERSTFVYCSNVSVLDHTAANLAGRFSLAQMEYAVCIGDERQARRAVGHLESVRERVRIAVGADSDLAVSLEFNQALGALWVAVKSGEQVHDLGSLRRRVAELGTATASKIPEAASASGMLSAAITAETAKRANRRADKNSARTDVSRIGRISREQLCEMSVDEITRRFGNHPLDTGRAEVQIALLQRRITMLTDHLKDSRSDHASRRGLFKLVAKRRRLLEYLEQQSIDRYRRLTYVLDIRRSSSSRRWKF